MDSLIKITDQEIRATVRCAIYVRCASFTQGEPHPFAVQLGVCEDYAAQKKWETVTVYKDNEFRSCSPFFRLSLDGMMFDARRGAFDVLLVADLNRLGRNTSRTNALLKEMETLGVAVHTVDGGVQHHIGDGRRRSDCALPRAGGWQAFSGSRAHPA